MIRATAQPLIAQCASDLAGIEGALAESFRNASKTAVPLLHDAQVGPWCEHVIDLAVRSKEVAEAFLQASPDALRRLSPAEFFDWAQQGLRLSVASGGWKAKGLAVSFFDLSPVLLDTLTPRALLDLADVVGRLVPHSVEVASSCLDQGATLGAAMDDEEVVAFIELGALIAREYWADAWLFFDNGPGLVTVLAPEVRIGALNLIARICVNATRQPMPLIAGISKSFSEIPQAEQARCIRLGEALIEASRDAAAEFLISVGRVRQRLDLDALEVWWEAGFERTAAGEAGERKAGEAFFSLESDRSQRLLAALSGGLELEHVMGMLELYAKALGDEHMRVSSADGRKCGADAGAAPSRSEGVTIVLPARMEDFDARKANLEAYEVRIAHQAGRYTFGSFEYEYGGDGHILESTALARERLMELERTSIETSFRRFLALFDDATLVETLFELVEHTRIDACVVSEYPGLRRGLRKVQHHAAAERPDVSVMGLRRGFVENLQRASLGCPEAMCWPDGFMPVLAAGATALGIVCREGATVQDSAEVTSILYDIASQIPNARCSSDEWVAIDPAALSEHPTTSVDLTEFLPGQQLEGVEIPFERPPDPAYRAGTERSLTEILNRPVARQAGEAVSQSMADDDAEQNYEEGSEQVPEGEQTVGGGESKEAELEVEQEVEQEVDQEEEDTAVVRWMSYDEWDYTANDYRQGWCRVGERSAVEGGLDYYADTLRRHHALVLGIRRQFELLRPESMRRIKRLEDGHEIDLDQAVAFHIDRIAGTGPLPRVYSRRDKVERSVVVAFLLDISGSTGDGIVDNITAAGDAGEHIIDVERDAAVLIVEALEAIGDDYGVFGFSGYGRKNVAYHVVKELDQPFDDVVRRRIDGIEPQRATRMGAAIRHTNAKLARHPAKVKILMLISDGRPMDQGYGSGPDDAQYAVHDTKRALVEGKVSGITPFLITVDAEGHDYLGEMCQDVFYEVVADIESLPRRIPVVYQRIAAP